jgi:hypothetical protein
MSIAASSIDLVNAQAVGQAPVLQASAAAVPALPEAPESAFELVMRDRPELNTYLLDEPELAGWIQRLVGISALGLGMHGLAVGVVVQSLDGVQASMPWLQGHPALWMPLTLIGALLGALAVCLPSFYFYTQLSGLDASFRLVTAQALRVQARTSVLLLAVLPFYAALALGCAVHPFLQPQTVVVLGLAIPFLVGLEGIRSLYRSFGQLLEVLPITHRRRGDFVLRMVLCWGAVYSVVAPVAVWRLGELLGRVY